MNGSRMSRRQVTIGSGIAAALGLTALGISLPRFLGHRYRQTPYDDLLGQLIDREQSVKVGKVAFDEISAPSGIIDFTPKAPVVAKELRTRMGRRTFAEATNADLAQSDLMEVRGWVLPRTLVLLSVLAYIES